MCFLIRDGNAYRWDIISGLPARMSALAKTSHKSRAAKTELEHRCHKVPNCCWDSSFPFPLQAVSLLRSTAKAFLLSLHKCILAHVRSQKEATKLLKDPAVLSIALSRHPRMYHTIPPYHTVTCSLALNFSSLPFQKRLKRRDANQQCKFK